MEAQQKFLYCCCCICLTHILSSVFQIESFKTGEKVDRDSFLHWSTMVHGLTVPCCHLLVGTASLSSCTLIVIGGGGISQPSEKSRAAHQCPSQHKIEVICVITSSVVDE